MDIYFTVWVIFQNDIVYFVAQILTALALSYFLALPDALGLSCIFCALALESATSSRSPAVFL